MTVLYSISLAFSKRTDIPKCLCAVDGQDEKAVKELERLVCRAHQIDIHYTICVDTEFKHKTKSPEARLNQRLRNLENRAKKAAPLFWTDIVESEKAKRPDYYTIEGVKKMLDESEAYLQRAREIYKPAYSLAELESALNRIAPFINPEMEEMMRWRYEVLERQKMINAMPPVERKSYLEEQCKKDPCYRNIMYGDIDDGEGEMLNIMRSI